MNIKQLRKLRGLTQEELSERIGVHENTIRLWERGVREPRLSDMAKLCEVLGCTESELLNGPADGRVRLTLVYDWGQMKEGNIDMTGNDFELILGSQGQIGLKDERGGDRRVFSACEGTTDDSVGRAKAARSDTARIGGSTWLEHYRYSSMREHECGRC